MVSTVEYSLFTPGGSANTPSFRVFFLLCAKQRCCKKMDRLCRIVTIIFIVCIVVSSARAISSIFRLPIFGFGGNTTTDNVLNVTVNSEGIYSLS